MQNHLEYEPSLDPPISRTSTHTSWRCPVLRPDLADEDREGDEGDEGGAIALGRFCFVRNPILDEWRVDAPDRLTE